jgi:hypothetical protein
MVKNLGLVLGLVNSRDPCIKTIVIVIQGQMSTRGKASLPRAPFLLRNIPGTARQIYITAKTQITLGPPHRGMPIYGLTPALSDYFPPHRVENQ